MVDERCPSGEYLFDDLLRSIGGAFRCIAQGRIPMDADLKNYDFPVCDRDNYETCTVFLRQNPLEPSSV